MSVLRPSYPALVSQSLTRSSNRPGTIERSALCSNFVCLRWHWPAYLYVSPAKLNMPIQSSPIFPEPASARDLPTRCRRLGNRRGPPQVLLAGQSIPSILLTFQAPAYLPSQLVSIGAGGWITVKFSRPVLNHPRNRFGTDFIIFGNSFFVITNGNYSGDGITDGSIYGNGDLTRVSVSRDGVVFYQLNPALAPTVDGLLPTDGSGDFHTPADPSLSQTDFAGLTLEGIRALYYGSAGGAGYDISWAQDADGRPVLLPEISYVRVEVLSGKSDLDGFASVFAPPGHSRQGHGRGSGERSGHDQ